jgi:hypothetical protein
MKTLAVLTALTAVLFSNVIFAEDKKENGQGRRHQKIEEVRVKGIDLSKPVPYRVGLTNIVLQHKYDERKDSWVYIGYKDLSKES